MKTNLFIAMTLFSVASMANSITLLNDSDQSGRLPITYQLIYQNPGENPQFGPRKTLYLNPHQAKRINFDMKDHKLAGIVPLRIDNIVLPSNANAFDHPEQCSLATNAQHSSGKLVFALHGKYGQGGDATCVARGGIFG